MEIWPPAPALYSVVETTPLRGSELLFAGMPRPIPSTKACILLFHCAATSGLGTVVTSTCRRLSSVKNFFWSSDTSDGCAPLSAKGLLLYVDALKYPRPTEGIDW